MPRHNAAEAMPMPEPPKDEEIELKESDLEEVEDLTEETDEAKAAEQEGWETKEWEAKTQESKKVAEEKLREEKEWEARTAAMKAKAEEAAAKDKASWDKMYKEIAPDMTEQVHEVDPQDEERYKKARAALDASPDFRHLMPPEGRIPVEPPPIPKDAKKPSLLKRMGKWFRG